MELSKEIGKRIRDIRGSMSQAAFAKKLKVTQPTLGRYERGSRSPDAEFILLLHNNYNVNPNWIVTGEEPKYIQNGISVDKPKRPYLNKLSENENKPDSPNLTKVIIEHQDIIKKFKDPIKAKEFNEFLIDIENEDPEGYNELYKEAMAISKTIRRLKKKSEASAKDDIQNRKSS